MRKLAAHFDPGSQAVVAITFVLFVGALFSKGFTHDLLLEAGVFLISVKLIVMQYKSGVTAAALRERLDAIHATLEQMRAAAEAARPAVDAAPPAAARGASSAHQTRP
jgi:hypothetical protein